MKDKKIIQAESSKPSKEDIRWLEYMNDTILETPERLENTAKFLSGMISISLTIFLIGDKDIISYLNPNHIKLVTVFWLMSLIFVFLVIFQKQNTFIDKSPESIRKTHYRIIRFKYTMLVMAAFFYFLALGILSWLIIFC